ncbi:MAG: DUF58 domain-containing protein [Sphingomonadales bacterium]|nr:DUF58 domain-containing protein [Sphingomonadales bacterium]
MNGVPVPTARTVAVLAALAPLGLAAAVLAPALWPAAPVAGAALLALALLDALLAGRPEGLRVIVPADVAVGEDARAIVRAELSGRPGTVSAALAMDARLNAGGRSEGDLSFDPADGAHCGALAFRPLRRGTGSIDMAWLRWTGPLGLGARAARTAIGTPVRVLPDLAPTRSPAIQALLRQSQLGMIARRLKGEGTMFEALADYEPGMDRRRIDWKASARHARLYAKEYEAERNNQIVLAFDCGRAMCEPVGGVARLDRALTAALTTAWVALKGGDRVMLYGFAARVLLATPFASDARAFRRLQEAAAELDYRPEEANFTLALASLAARLQRRSLVVVFSEFTDPAGAELMLESVGRLVRRHRVLFVTLADEELETIAGSEPDSARTLAAAVSAGALLRQRAGVVQRLRGMGVDVIEAGRDAIGPRLLDSYLAIRQQQGIG